MGSLQKAIYTGQKPKKGRFRHTSISQAHTPLNRVLETIYYLPLSWRKWILDGCRIQESMYQNQHLLSSSSKLTPNIIAIPSIAKGRVDTWSPHDTMDYFEHMYDSPLVCSILSYFCRAESTTSETSSWQKRQSVRQRDISRSPLLHATTSAQLLLHIWR